jgi:hypothetical protein
MEMALSVGEVIKKARTELHNLIGLEISSTVRAVREDEGWLVSVEVIEKHSIPDGMDILATYESKLDSDGNLLEFKRIKMRKRIDMEDSEE